MAEPIVLKERVEIDPDRPLPAFNLKNAAAYAAKARRESQGDLLAYVCDPRIPPRHDDLESMRGFTPGAMFRFVEWGPVTWRPLNRRVPVVVYEMPLGGRVATQSSDTIEPMSDEAITRNFLTPVMGLLRDLSARGVPHRAIRPDNLFYSDVGKRHIILGDALTCPPGLYNPAFCETLEQAMADPVARGRGGVGDDLYAVGVCLIFLLLGRNPAHDVAPETLIERKITQSSYSALTAGARIQMNMVELLRGLLADDPRERWSVREVELWIGGRRLTPKQAKLPTKAARPIMVAGHGHDNVRSVAQALGRNWLVSGEVVRGQDFDNWIRRSLGDERVVESITKVLGSQAMLAKSTDADNAKLVTRACMALDPAAPIRHKGFSCHIDGVGPALAMEFEREDTRQKVADFVNGKFVGTWMSLQNRNRSDLSELYGTFDKLPVPLNMTGAGFGIERVLYELNAHMHCLSPLIEAFYVTTVDRLIPAIEGAAKGKDRPRSPVDRHIAAFAAARTTDVDERYLRPLSANDQTGTDQILAALTLLGRIQVMSKSPPAPTLAAWFAELMEPAVNNFNNLKQRKAVEQNVTRAAETGMLMELHGIYADQKSIQRDQQGYNQAQQEHRYCGAQIEQLSHELNNREHMATELGEQVAAVASGVVGSLDHRDVYAIAALVAPSATPGTRPPMAVQSASSAATRTILIAVIGGGAVFILPSVMILGIGMTPTLAAMITDRRKEKYATLCVGCMNFTGVLPFMIELWTNDHSYDNAFRLIGEPFTWLVMFGAAAIGWAIYFVAPGIVGMFIGMRADQRIQRLRRRQRDLVEEWGPGVAGNKKDDGAD